MDRIVTFLLLLVSALLLVPGCIADEQAAVETTEIVADVEVTEEAVEEAIAFDYTADMNTTALNMTSGQVVLVQLPEDETTGFEWNATLSEGLNLVSEDHMVAEGIENVTAFHQWYITAVNAGEQIFNSVEMKEDSEEIGTEYTLNILVE
ncbi:MAG: hypothetical protein GXY48_11290 [Methanomicrobiales archaeon]|nr:hypothetical protein [Methanomicrobiales archaeon]